MPAFAVTNPATGETIETITDTTAQQAAAQVGAAHEAFQQWRGTAPRKRAEILMAAFHGMHAQSERLRDSSWPRTASPRPTPRRGELRR